MSDTTWPPSWDSKFTFRIDRKLRATVGSGERAFIRDLPVNRKILVEVRLDGKPFESFRLDLSRKEGQRTCLWLYSGYWHWVDMGWDEKKGCLCE